MIYEFAYEKDYKSKAPRPLAAKFVRTCAAQQATENGSLPHFGCQITTDFPGNLQRKIDQGGLQKKKI